MNEGYHKATNYIKGFVAAISLSPIPSELSEDNDFNDGWVEGRATKKTILARAEQKYGVKFEVLKLMADGSGLDQPSGIHEAPTVIKIPNPATSEDQNSES